MLRRINRRQFLTSAGLLGADIALGPPLLGSSRNASTSTALPDSLLALVSTFSIVAYDPETEAWGVAISSRALASGALLVARAGAGVIANQSLPDISAGNAGIELLAQGTPAGAVLDRMIDIDSTDGMLLEPIQAALRDQFGIEMEALRDIRQIGLIDATGQAVAFTGDANIPWAGHITGEGFACQGNSLAGAQVVEAMAETYAEAFTTDLAAASSSGDFADRLLAALQAGEEAGGDSRHHLPRNSAGLLVAKESVTQYGRHDRFIDLRVDHDDDPITRLIQLRDMHRQDFGS